MQRLIADELWQCDVQYSGSECGFRLIRVNLNGQVEYVEGVLGQDFRRVVQDLSEESILRFLIGQPGPAADDESVRLGADLDLRQAEARDFGLNSEGLDTH